MNAIRFVEADELRAGIGFEDLIEPVSMAFQKTSARLAASGLLVMHPGRTTSSGDVYVKAGTLQGSKIYVVKVSPWFAANVDQGRRQGGFIAVFDSETGHTLAIIDEQHYLSDIRTAAAGCLAARVLAPATVHSVTVLGSGVQAYWQPQALYRERQFETLLIWARNAEKANLLRRRLSSVLPAVEIRVESDIESAVRQSQVLISATLAREPLVSGHWLVEGQHITAVGADDPIKCELDASVLRRASVFVDSLEANASNGDVARAIQAGRYSIDQVSGEIGEVLAGSKAGRRSSREITIAKFVGIGAQDLAAAEASLSLLGCRPAVQGDHIAPAYSVK